MFLAKIVFVVFTCATLTNYVFAQADEPEEEIEELEDKDLEEETPPPPLDNHTFVALIDIVFTDGLKRTCTGTIIHDNAVITAAHCFLVHNTYVQPELTASFVVIGTKRMFETGYENYLPIERVITHPKFKGWTADVALVYTFAGMTSDKPGNIIPLVGENTLTAVDSDVTILSWGHCKDETPEVHTRAPAISTVADTIKSQRICDSSDDNDDSCEPLTTPAMVREGGFFSPHSSVEKESGVTESFPYQYGRQGPDSMTTAKIRSRLATLQVSYDKRPAKMQKFSKHKTSRNSTRQTRWTTTKFSNLYLTSSEAKEKNRKNKRDKKKVRAPRRLPKHRYRKTQRNSTNSEDRSVVVMMDTKKLKLNLYVDPKPNNFETDQTRRKEHLMVDQGRGRIYFENKKVTRSFDEEEQTKSNHSRIQSYYKNWRRQLGPKENRLTVETFGFVNMQTCKKLVDRALPAVYSINPNYFVCYASEGHYINDEDSGAPAVRQGHLVAVTLGGVECEGDHVAIGIKMSCLCSWISDNLPNGGANMKCCKNCCNDNNEEKKVNNMKRNKYLY